MATIEKITKKPILSNKKTKKQKTLLFVLLTVGPCILFLIEILLFASFIDLTHDFTRTLINMIIFHLFLVLMFFYVWEKRLY